MNLGTLTQFEQSENYVPINERSETSLQGVVDEFQSNGWEWNRTFVRSSTPAKLIRFLFELEKRKKTPNSYCVKLLTKIYLGMNN